MKYPIKWHEQCLFNSANNLAVEKQRLQEQIDRVDAWYQRNEFYARQINEAKARGKDGFDADKFLKSKQKPL